MSENDEVLAKSKKPLLLPTHRGTSNGINIPPENLRAMNLKRGQRILVNVTTKRGRDGKPYLIIEKVRE